MDTPSAPRWEGDLELHFAKQDNNEGDSDDQGHCLKQVIESPVWMTIRDFLSTSNVLEMHTTAHKWNVARLYGPEAEFIFLVPARDDRDNPASRPEWPELQPSYTQLFDLVRKSLIKANDNSNKFERQNTFLRELAW